MSFADEMPELYPPGTGKAVHDEVANVLKALGNVVDSNLSAKPDEQFNLIAAWCKSNGYSVSPDRNNPKVFVVFIASVVAPELDNWIHISWPEERNLDSQWQV